MPSMTSDIHNSLCTTNSLSVKGAGAAGAIGAPPAVANAIVDGAYGREACRYAANGSVTMGGD